MKKKLLIFIFVLLVFIPAGSFANSTGNIIIKEYDDMGNFEYKSIPEADYNDSKMSTFSTKSNRIEYIQEDLIRSVSYSIGNKTSLSWGKDRIGSQNLIDRVGNTSNRVLVAILDTGIDSNHNFLKHRLVKGYNFMDDNYNTMDRNSHGTHVAGILTDSTNNNVKIMPVKVLGDDGIGSDYAVGNGIYYAVDNGADIINLSLGGKGQAPYVSEAIRYAASHDVLVVVAAGNKSSNTSDFYPASDELPIVVSATDEFDGFASFSNYGRSVDIAAPGANIYSSIPGGGYEYLSGTSMSTSYITALAALIKQEDLSRNIYEIERLLKLHIDDLGVRGKDIYFGEGIANVSNYPIGIPVKDNYPDYTLLDIKDNVPLNKEWTVAFSRNFKEEEVEGIRIMEGDKIIPSFVSHDGKSKIIVKTKLLYKKDTEYYLLISLKNGSKCKVRFKTLR